MKVIITAITDNIEGAFNPRFGRSDYFILVDTETKDWEAFQNPAASAAGGAGPQAVQFIADKGANAVISGRYGPSAFAALNAAGLEAFIAKQGSVNEVLEQFLADALESVDAPTGQGFHGAQRR
jgi:predicted Fe-Mo cluster-binding NifX family protein